MVRAKFKVTAITQREGSPEPLVSVELFPVTGGSEENKEFWKWSPSGKIELGTINPGASSQFEIGKEYYVDFTKAD